MNPTKSILLCAAITAIAGCATKQDKAQPLLFPEPFNNVYIGQSEEAFRKAWPEAVIDDISSDGVSWWTISETNGFEEAAFQFTPVDGKGDRNLSYAMLCYQRGASFREVLAEGESRLGPAPDCQTVLFTGALCFQRTWQFGQNESTLFFWPDSSGQELQWRIAATGPSAAHDDFLVALPADTDREPWAGFRIVTGERFDFNPSGDLPTLAARRLYDALSGWESFDPVDLEGLALADDGAEKLLCGHWIIEIQPPSPAFAVGADGSWVANLGTNGLARTIPESRRQDVLSALATVTNAATTLTSPTNAAP